MTITPYQNPAESLGFIKAASDRHRKIVYKIQTPSWVMLIKTRVARAAQSPHTARARSTIVFTEMPGSGGWKRIWEETAILRDWFKKKSPELLKAIHKNRGLLQHIPTKKIPCVWWQWERKKIVGTHTLSLSPHRLLWAPFSRGSTIAMCMRPEMRWWWSQSSHPAFGYSGVLFRGKKNNWWLCVHFSLKINNARSALSSFRRYPSPAEKKQPSQDPKDTQFEKG